MARKPKDAYYFYQSQWTDDPMVYIVSHTRRFYHGKTGESKRVRVYSNCETVELTLNGVSLGNRENQYVYFWDVVLKPGDNHIRAVARKGGVLVEDSLNVYFITDEDG